MNYIKQLQAQNKELTERLQQGILGLDNFKAYLQTSPKFQGPDTDGQRKDWIATQDVIVMLCHTRDALNGTGY